MSATIATRARAPPTPMPAAAPALRLIPLFDEDAGAFVPAVGSPAAPVAAPVPNFQESAIVGVV
jgi:hypothetical protein